MRQKQYFYDLSFKLKVIKLVMSGKESALSASRKFDIGGSMTVYRWISQYQCGKLRTTTRKAMDSRPIAQPQNSSEEDRLRNENEQLKLQVIALQTLLAVTEKELGINIKKNSSHKPSTISE